MFETINAMLEVANRSLEELREEYQSSLLVHEIPMALRNNVRRLLGDLRDPLDHVYQHM